MRWLAVLVLALGSTSRADSSEDATPVAAIASVRGTLAGPTATLTVRFTVRIAQPSVNYDIALAIPAESVATHATATVDGARHALAVTAADQVDRELQAIESAPSGPHPRWGIAVREAGAELGLVVAAPRAATVVVDLELSARTCFERDARYVLAPAAWRDAVPLELRAPSAPTSCSIAEGTWLRFAAPELARRPAGDARTAAFAGRLALGDEHFARLELDLAGRLGEVPADLATAIVVDASSSVTAAENRAQLELVAAYLRAVPASRVQLVAYDRRARALLPGWTTASLAATRAERELRALAPRNGSNVDAGLAEAGRWLARTPGTHRVVLFTDERLARRLAKLPTAELQRLVPPRTLVHVVVPTGGTAAPARDDSVALAELAVATEGLSIASGVPREGLDLALLARPIALDKIAITAPGWRQLDLDTQCLDTVAEGTACTWWGHGSELAGPIAVEARLWNRRYTRVLQPDPARAVDLARELATLRVLDDAAQRQAELASRAVNHSLSLYTAWGGRDGFSELSGRFTATSCCGDIGTSSHDVGRITVNPHESLPPLDLAPQLRPAVARCKLAGRTASAVVETTRSEIVDVAVTVAPADRALATCIEDAIWDTSLQISPSYPTAVSRVAL